MTEPGSCWRLRIEEQTHTVVVLDVSHHSDTYGADGRTRMLGAFFIADIDSSPGASRELIVRVAENDGRGIAP